MRRPLILLSAVLLAVALYVANVAWWMNSEVLDEDAFVETAVVVLNQPSSRDTMARIVVERLVEEIPLLLLVDDVLVNVFAELLGTEQLQNALVLVSEELHQRMVSGETGPIVIDLEPYRGVLLSPIEAIAPELAELVPESWFSSVEVLEGGVIPDLSTIAEKAPPVAIAAFIVAGALGALIVAVAERWMVRLAAVGASFLVAGGLSASTVPAGTTTVAAVVADTSREVLVANLYGELTSTLTARSLVLILVGVAMIAVALGLWVFGRSLSEA